MEIYPEEPVTTFMYFWLNHCEENHNERIPIVVKNTDDLFNLAAEIIKASSFFTF